MKSGYIKIFAVFIIVAAVTAVSLPAAEPACSSISQITTNQILSQNIKQLVRGLEYSDEVAENFTYMVNQWQNKPKSPILVTWEQILCQAKENYKQGKISEKQLAETQQSIATKLTHRIRKEITVDDNFFDLADIIKYIRAQCLGYCQLFYILGTSVGLSVRPVNVLELQTAEPLPAGFAHTACMVDLADGRTIMLNLVPGGFISRPFIFEEKFTKTGNYWKLKDKTNSLNIYRKIQALDREGLIAYIYINRGADHTSLGQLDEAASDYGRAISFKPDLAEAWNNRAAAYAKSGRLEQALSDYAQAISLNSDFAEAWSNRASAYIKLKRFQQAISDCNRAIEYNPRLAAAWNNRANAYAKDGRFDKAISDYNHAIKLNSKLVETYYNRAIIYGILGQYKQAISDFSSAIENNPNLAHAYGNRALNYAMLGKSEQAKKDLATATRLSPELASYTMRISERFKLGLNVENSPILVAK